jgi:hypothetical protein
MSSAVAEKIQRITQGKPNALSISFNEHWAIYRSIEEAIKEINPDDFPSPEERQRCLGSGELWNVYYYPRNQVGFISVYASTLDGALDYLIENMQSEGHQSIT